MRKPAKPARVVAARGLGIVHGAGIASGHGRSNDRSVCRGAMTALSTVTSVL